MLTFPKGTLASCAFRSEAGELDEQQMPCRRGPCIIAALCRGGPGWGCSRVGKTREATLRGAAAGGGGGRRRGPQASRFTET
eukprot:7923595-Pyramimonas_sp.AAC.1